MDENQYHHNRNYGSRQTEIVLKGYRALVVENEKLRTTILLDKGTDIYELLYKPADVDFMWRSPLALDGRNRNPVTKELASGSVMDNYEGGWQELLPSISTPTDYKGMGLGFHGEAAFLPWECRVMEDTPPCVRVELSVPDAKGAAAGEKDSHPPLTELGPRVRGNCDERGRRGVRLHVGPPSRHRPSFSR